MTKKHSLPFNPENLKRELKKYYISSSEEEIDLMLADSGHQKLSDVYTHLDKSLFFEGEKLQALKSLDELSYGNIPKYFEEVAKKNNIKISFTGDALKNYSTPEIVPFVCDLRGLTTAYTPYQPERSQGTLWSLWFFSNLMSRLTGFEAINASLYDRSTGLFEAINTSKKISRSKSNVFLVSEGIHPNDLNVLETLVVGTNFNIKKIPLNKQTGKTDVDAFELLIKEEDVFGIAFNQTTCMGVLEDVDKLTDISQKHNIVSVGVIDPILLCQGGLKKPSEFGSNKTGVDIIIGEAQHLALRPNFGGPGLGIFGVRFNEKQKSHIRSTPGRYIGKTIDKNGHECLSMVLSTREQHIRRDKATSNICSNQSFVATIIGASLLAQGDDGLRQKIDQSKENLNYFLEKIQDISTCRVAFPTTGLNECVIEVPDLSVNIIREASINGIHIGVDATKRAGINKNLIHLFFNDMVSKEDIDKLIQFLASLQIETNFETTQISPTSLTLLNNESSNILKVKVDELKEFYTKLSKLNVSPDDNIYPLGSCTMKYNPYINDYNASLNGFTESNPEIPLEDSQGSLEILWEVQEAFKKITGLPGVTTQPVAGAQGELVGIKMFQAYHRSKNENRDIILIPKSAHGTNPATATMAGIETTRDKGIVLVDADESGQVDLGQIKSAVKDYGTRIIGVMVTNPNTSGIFESNFKEMSDLIHSVDGLVYMDGANMNAIAGIIDLSKLGVDAVHNNLHKTWTIPHGGGGPGDAIVAVSKKLIDYLPGIQVSKNEEKFNVFRTQKCIGDFHRHFGNFAHKVRCLSYLKALGFAGIQKMASVAVLSSVYLNKKIENTFPTLPRGAEKISRMHEFIITLSPEDFESIINAGIPKSQIIGKLGKLFLDFGMHAPTVSFPEPFGLMIEPTESFTKSELDRFIQVLKGIKTIITKYPEVLNTVPHFTPIKKVDEVKANKELILIDNFDSLPNLPVDDISALNLQSMTIEKVIEEIKLAHKKTRIKH
jgi:glycine dehydrogenase